MRAVIQRVSEASVSIEGSIHGQINAGLLVLLGIEHNDTMEDGLWLARKITNLRIFSDAEGKMNQSLDDVQGGILLISQFTLHASTKKGNRPSYIKAARPEQAIPLYEEFIRNLEQETGTRPQTGVFGANMQVSLLNDGPVTLIIDSQNKE